MNNPDQWKIDYAAARRPRTVSLRDIEWEARRNAPPPPPTAEEQRATDEAQARAIIGAEMRKIRAEALDAGVRAGLATARAMERIRR